jgi:hypothetical protein
MIRRDQPTKALDFLEIPRHKWASKKECTIRTSDVLFARLWKG